MIVPEKQKGVRSFKIPGIFLRSLAFVFVLTSILFGILLYNYWSVIKQIHENRHLGLENRQLREQIKLFELKMATVAKDLENIRIYENKLRIITGLEDVTKTAPIVPSNDQDQGVMMDDHGATTREPIPEDESVQLENNILPYLQNFENNPSFIELQRLYDERIAAHFGLSSKYKVTRQFSDLIKKSFELSEEYAKFDYKFQILKKYSTKLEEQIHKLDQHLLDKESILRSTPTILPTNGWITSYFGHRISPTAGVKKMHEGLDVGANFGTEILAPADGIVTFAGRKAGFGLFVQIDHGYGIETIYAHSQKIITKSGNKVKRGDLIAKVGSTGASTGPHLHYEVRINGTAVDPLYFVLE
tara:strand:- start:21924 stop:23000 length:1077 start_codon:yes stop_codon:yes gene_type:complete